uniref:Uncharacterized protein n=1 Tax=Anguilla anguilla TaxID=7936 RepID=A0A0E9VHN3_ANGAN
MILFHNDPTLWQQFREGPFSCFSMTMPSGTQ